MLDMEPLKPNKDWQSSAYVVRKTSCFFFFLTAALPSGGGVAGSGLLQWIMVMVSLLV